MSGPVDRWRKGIATDRSAKIALRRSEDSLPESNSFINRRLCLEYETVTIWPPATIGTRCRHANWQAFKSALVVDEPDRGDTRCMSGEYPETLCWPSLSRDEIE